jgi:hypothetical protein
MAIKDIDLSFETNIYDDLSVLLDKEAIKARLFNDIMIPPDEIPFNDEDKITVPDALHEYSFVAEDTIQDLVTSSIQKDTRIDELSEVRLNDNAGDVYQRSKQVDLDFILSRKLNNEPISVSLIITKT